MKAEDSAPLLEVHDLRVRLGGRTIVDGVSFQVRAGELCALVGPNGSGKTTLLRSILGQMPHHGTIRLRLQGDSQDAPSGTDQIARETVGYVPQLFPFDPSLPVKVADLFALATPGRPLFLRRGSPSGMDELLSKVGAAGLAQRLLGQLSGGELRRVLLAQALFRRPALLLLDEPGSHLDEQGLRHFDNLLPQLVRDGGPAILVVAHGRQELLQLAHRVIEIGADGRRHGEDP